MKNLKWDRVTVRTTKLTLILMNSKEAFGQDKGRFGGGRTGAGGFEIPMGFLSGSMRILPTPIKWEVFDAQIKQKLLRLVIQTTRFQRNRALSGEHRKLNPKSKIDLWNCT